MTASSAPSRIKRPWARVRPWIDLHELPKHLANLLPFMLGTTLAFWESGQIDRAVFAVALLALFLLTDGTYISNEYFDYENDRINLARIGGADAVGVTTTGGTRVLVKGLISRRHALMAAVAGPITCSAGSARFRCWCRCPGSSRSPPSRSSASSPIMMPIAPPTSVA